MPEPVPRPTPSPACAVIGGGGFVGKYLVRLLLSPSLVSGVVPPFYSRVLVLDVRFNAATTKLFSALQAANPLVALEHRVLDIRSPSALALSLSGISTVFLLAAVIDWKLTPSPVLHSVNVVGTDNVLSVCRACGVQRLVHASTMDVVLTGEDIENCDETRPYPPDDAFLSEYCRTKTLSEKLVLGANSKNIATTSMRFGHVYGPEDLIYIPKILAVLKKGAMPLRLGPSDKKTEMVFSGNAAYSMLLADHFMRSASCGGGDSSGIGGNAYFIGEGYSANMLDLARPFADKLGIEFPTYTLPSFVLSFVIWVLLVLHKALGIFGVEFDPDLNSFSVWFFRHNMTFSSDKALKDFGYRPLFTRKQAFEETLDWVRTLSL